MLTNIFAMVTQKVSIKGSYVGNRHETEEALSIMMRAGFKLRSKVVDFRDLTNIYEMMENGTWLLIKELDFPGLLIPQTHIY